jgi:FdhD protein
MDVNQSNALAVTIGTECHNLRPEGISAGECELIVEEPLLITVDDKPIATLMCTPEDEISLSLGFMYTEGIIRSEKDVGAVAFCRNESGNVVRFMAAEGVDLASRLSAHRAVFSSCSICGREAIQAVASCLKPFDRRECRISPRAIVDLGALMNSRQRFFKRTGGTHAAIMGQIRGGGLLSESAILKEDIGRHNALDKVVGDALKRKVPLGGSLLFLSGRMSFEMVAKAARAGISDIAAVSAPTALAVELARQLNMLLVGFARGASAVVYSGKEALIAEQ